MSIATTLAIAVLTRSTSCCAPSDDSLFSAEPLTRLVGLLEAGEALREVAVGDFDGDGRVDAAVLGSQGTFAILHALGERQRGTRIELDDAAPRSLAVLERDGRDALLLAGEAGLTRVEYDEDGEVLITLLSSGSLDRVMYERNPDMLFAMAWVVHRQATAVEALLFDPATGALVYSAGALALPVHVSQFAIVDIDGNGVVEIAMTFEGGLLVADALANTLASAPRGVDGSSLERDRLTRLVDASGRETIAWLESDGVQGLVRHVTSEGASASPIELAGAHDFTSGDVDGDGLCDLVFGVDQPDTVRVLLSSDSSPRFTPGGPGDVVEVSASPWSGAGDGSGGLALVDLDRDLDLDLVRVQGDLVATARGTRLSAQALQPKHAPSQSSVSYDEPTNQCFVLLTFLEPPAGPHVERVDVRVFGGTYDGATMLSSPAALESFQLESPTWPLELPLTLTPQAPNGLLWFVELTAVHDSSTGAGAASVVVAVTPSAMEGVTSESAPGESLWIVHFVEPPVTTFGQGTKGSAGQQRLPRLPPPPPQGSATSGGGNN